MWTRKELKLRGKEAMKRNYWKSVFAAMVLSLIMGGSTYSNFSNGFSNGYKSAGQKIESDTDIDIIDYYDVDIDDVDVDDIDIDDVDDVDPEFQVGLGKGIVMAVLFASFVTMFVILFALGCVLDIFVVNPFELGVVRFFVKNQQRNADVKEIMFGFDHSYKNTIKVLFFRDLYVSLWFLLFIIPGIVKSYEYRMMPYLLAENPDMDKETAFATSKAMMQGQKWKTFVLDLSFIWWDLLGIFTCGVVSMFFVAPYKWNTKAALFEALKAGRPELIETEIDTVDMTQN